MAYQVGDDEEGKRREGKKRERKKAVRGKWSDAVHSG